MATCRGRACATKRPRPPPRTDIPERGWLYRCAKGPSHGSQGRTAPVERGGGAGRAGGRADLRTCRRHRRHPARDRLGRGARLESDGPGRDSVAPPRPHRPCSGRLAGRRDGGRAGPVRGDGRGADFEREPPARLSRGRHARHHPARHQLQPRCAARGYGRDAVVERRHPRRDAAPTAVADAVRRAGDDGKRAGATHRGRPIHRTGRADRRQDEPISST